MNQSPSRPSSSTVEQLFVGGLRPLPPEGQSTGIFKTATAAPVRLGREGLDGDRHGDPRHHGGPEKALHQYPAEHYGALAARFPAIADLLVPGVLGENVSSTGMDEHSVCIGDIYGIGGATVQLSQPRQPCWRINHRLGVELASRFVAERGLTGWYYRVLAVGPVAAGDEIVLLERPNPELTLARYWRTINAHRPDPAVLREVAAAPGLAADKAARLRERADWLADNPGAPG